MAYVVAKCGHFLYENAKSNVYNSEMMEKILEFCLCSKILPSGSWSFIGGQNTCQALRKSPLGFASLNGYCRAMTDLIQIDFMDASFPMQLHSGDELVSNIIRKKGYYSSNDLMVMRKLLREGDVFFDIGANVGWHSLYAAQWVGVSGKVFAFEPEDENFKILSANTNSFSNITPVQLALGEQQGDFRLVGFWENRGNHMIDFTKDFAAPLSQQVRMTKLDDFLSSAGLEQIRFIKIDAQGCEVKILRGAGELIKRSRPFVQAEFSPAHIRFCGDSIFDILSFLDRNNYLPFWLQEQDDLSVEQILRPVSISDLLYIAQDLNHKELGVDILMVPSERLNEFSNAIRTA